MEHSWNEEEEGRGPSAGANLHRRSRRVSAGLAFALAWARLAFVWRALVLLTVIAYLPVVVAGFIWDDDAYVTHNFTLHDWGGLVRLWSDRYANPQYYPLVHTSFWIEYHIWGLNPLGYHVVNVLLHAANAVLLLILLRRLAVPGAFLAAALFAVHPVEVESVAWVTERKNVLSGFFYLISFLMLLRAWPMEEERPRLTGRWPAYLSALVLFAAALFSKTVACSLPAAFLVVRWWKVGRLGVRDVLAMAPFFALGVALGLNTAQLEREHVGAYGTDWDFSPRERVLIAGRAVWFYAGKLAWPAELTFIYPRWRIDAGSWWQYVYPAAAVGLVVGLFALRGRIGRGPLAAVLFFVGTLVPALGFFNVYPMRFSFVADHFQYLASVGLLTLIAAGVARIRAGLDEAAKKRATAVLVFIVFTLTIVTWQQTLIYENQIALWNDTLAKNPDCWMGYENRGMAEIEQGNLKDALADFQRAIDLKADYEQAYYNRGLVHQQYGQFEAALRDYTRAIELKPDYAQAYVNRGAVLLDLGRYPDAVADDTEALRLRPDFRLVYFNRATAYMQLKRYDDAWRDVERGRDLGAQPPAGLIDQLRRVSPGRS